MAKAPTEEQSQLKRRARRRLVGSIALVTVIAVVLPWILEGEPRNGEQPIALQIPSPNVGKSASRSPEAAAPAADDVGRAAGFAPAEDVPKKPVAESATDTFSAEQDKVLAPPVKTPATKSAASRQKSAEKRAAESVRKATDKSSDKASADNKPYVVQVTALADAEKAAQIQKALAAKGLKSYTEKVQTAGGEVTRVRVGPFSNRDAAEKERRRMKSLGFDGNVVPK